MSAAERLGQGFRRIGSLTGIRHVREEHSDRINHHGGEVAELNEKLVAFADRIETRVAKLEREVLS